MNSGRCRSCNAPILWARTARDAKPIPLDPEPRADGNIHVDEWGTAHVVGKAAGQGSLSFEAPSRYVTHFTTCPQAEEHRKR